MYIPVNWLLLGFINTFLSWEAFGPLGRLAFNIYLVQYPVIAVVFPQFTYPVVATFLLIVSKSSAHMSNKQQTT